MSQLRNMLQKVVNCHDHHKRINAVRDLSLPRLQRHDPPLRNRQWQRSALKEPQWFALVHGDMIGLIALDLVLRIVLARVMDVAFVVHVGRMHLYDMAADPASFGVPGYVIADFECLRHERMVLHLIGMMLP